MLEMRITCHFKADCLKETQAFIFEKFVTGMMAKSGKKGSKDKNTDKEDDDDETENEGDDGKFLK